MVISPQVLFEISNLRTQGLSARKIAQLIGCSHKAVLYHTTPGQKEKERERTREYSQTDLGKQVKRRAWAKYCKTEGGREVRRNIKRRCSLGTIINGKHVYLYGLKKRLYPGSCELCSKVGKRLVYHHWKPDNLNIGLWLCCQCHQVAEAIEKDLHTKYYKLKTLVENESQI